MSKKDAQHVVAGWAYAAMRPEVANTAAASVFAPLSEVPRKHGNVTLTPVAHAFLAYWWHIRGDKIIPTTDDVSLPHMRTLAPYVRYMHWDGNALIHRYWGSALSEGVGVDMTGHDVMSYVPEDRRAANHAMLRALHDQPCGVVLVTRDTTPSGTGLSAEMTFLPVGAKSDGGQRLIGTMQWRETDGMVTPLNVQAGEPQPLTLEQVSFIDVGAGRAPDALAAQL